MSQEYSGRELPVVLSDPILDLGNHKKKAISNALRRIHKDDQSKLSLTTIPGLLHCSAVSGAVLFILFALIWKDLQN